MSEYLKPQGRRQFLETLGKAVGSMSLVAFASPLLAETAAPVMLQGVRARSEGDTTHLTFELSDASDHKVFSLGGPDRVVLDFKQVRLAPGARFDIDDAGPVNKLRYAARDGGDFRVVLDVARPLKVSSRLVTGGDGGRQLQVTLGGYGGVAAPAPVAAAAAVQAAVPARQQTEVVAKVEAPAQAGKSSPRSRGRGRDLIVAIDAGHGGKDPGAVGLNGTREKDIVLSVARKLGALVNKEPGFRAVLIRDADVFLPLRARIRKARQEQADLFISIHADASPNRDAQGSSVFILSENGASSEAAKLLAEQENSVDLIGGVKLDDKDEMLAEVLLDLSQRHSLESSHNIASGLLTELQKVGGIHSRRVEQAGFAVLKSPDIPSVLVETAFISNPREEKRLRTSQYQNEIAKSLLKGVRAHFIANAPQDSFLAMRRGDELAGAQHIIRDGETLSGIASRYNVPTKALRDANRMSGDSVNAGQVLTIPPVNT